MRSYRIDVRETEHGWLAECAAFGAAVDAAELMNAVDGVRLECEDIARRMLMEGRALPADEPLGPGWSGKALYFRTAVQEEYEAGNQAPVRRNVSMPAWLDRMLRKNNIDASRLFQDAAMAKLAELERARGGFTRIASVSDLEAACLPGVLDEYFDQRLSLGAGRLGQLVDAIGKMKEDTRKLEALAAEGFSALLQETKKPGFLEDVEEDK